MSSTRWCTRRALPKPGAPRRRPRRAAARRSQRSSATENLGLRAARSRRRSVASSSSSKSSNWKRRRKREASPGDAASSKMTASSLSSRPVMTTVRRPSLASISATRRSRIWRPAVDLAGSSCQASSMTRTPPMRSRSWRCGRRALISTVFFQRTSYAPVRGSTKQTVPTPRWSLPATRHLSPSSGRPLRSSSNCASTFCWNSCGPIWMSLAPDVSTTRGLSASGTRPSSASSPP
mmetsp:Transcript_24820/g.98524  ORF Transcript_24820/g.98524 Transcript_24820/m.98524 type:complete len:235 (+) Transcript_24820:1684-2388(+)